ncbi:MAG: signal recognition particle protein, partial [Verrucomicrobia bacterium]|nr:signal recognition particle protein [Verrucomicrobiota bacterium]
SLGDSVLKSVSPDQYFTKIVHDELVDLMGVQEEPLALKGSPAVVMLCGLQGSGKTTHCAKLAYYLLKKDKQKKILLAACDLQRPAAVEQLKRLGEQVGVVVFSVDSEKDPIKVATLALEKAKKESFDILIVDTAGRLHVDEELMTQLEKLKKILEPSETLFVASSQTGQDAVKTAQEFDKRISITGTILTMLDGSARAGAAISIREITQKPLKFEGIGEKIADLQPFNPRSMADRILGMGDVINLVRKSQEHFTEQENEEMEKKLLKASFTYGDYLKALSKMKKMGSFKSLLKMIPGMPSLDDIQIDEKEMVEVEAIILSMTPKEREEKVELIPSRRRRIAMGSGTDIEDVNRLVKKFKKMKQFLKDMPSLKKQMLKGAGNKENFLWR